MSEYRATHTPCPLQAAQAAGLENETNEFVQIADGDFVVGCKKFFVSGWNQWEVVEAAAGALELFGATLPEEKTGPQVPHQAHEHSEKQLQPSQNVWSILQCTEMHLAIPHSLKYSFLSQMCQLRACSS